MAIKPRFITGFFFQGQRPLGLGIGSDGVQVMIYPEEIMGSLFSGVLFEDPEAPERWTGQTIDHYGEATLRNFHFTATELRFEKSYNHRGDAIFYAFRRSETETQQWTGTYRGAMVGKGKANCLIMEIPADMLLPSTK